MVVVVGMRRGIEVEGVAVGRGRVVVVVEEVAEVAETG